LRWRKNLCRTSISNFDVERGAGVAVFGIRIRIPLHDASVHSI
jgi:hypothetical protein